MPASNPYRIKRLNVGDVFADTFEILEELGHGRFGMRYLVRAPEWDRRIVLQPFKRGLDPQRRRRHRLADDWTTLGRLREPALTDILEFGETDDDRLYAVLEYLGGESLERRIAQYGAHPPEQAIAIGLQVARGLSAAHNQDVLHRNLQPDDITLAAVHSEEETAHVDGFGTVQLLDSYGSDLTRGIDPSELEMYGALRFLSPELVRGRPLDPRSDIYSFGLLLYEMLVGTPGIRGQSDREVLGAHVAPQPHEFNNITALPQQLRSIVRRCTRKSPDDRYQGADILLRDLEDARDAIGPSASTGTSPGHGEGPVPNVPGAGQENVTRNYEEQLDDLERPPGPGESRPPRRDSVTRGAVPQSERSGEHESASRVRDSEREDVRTTGRSPALGPGGDDDDQGVEPDALGVGFRALRVVVYVAFMGLGGYLAFIVVGALIGQFFEETSRLLITLFLTFTVPILVGLREFTIRERFREQFGLVGRFERATLLMGLLMTGTALLGSLALPGVVIEGIRQSPNWFVDNTSLERWNRVASGTAAEAIEFGTEAVGVYRPDGENERRGRRVTSPPSDPSTYTATEVMEGEYGADAGRSDAGRRRSDAGLDGGRRRQRPSSPTPSPSDRERSKTESSSESDPAPKENPDGEEPSGFESDRNGTYQRWNSGAGSR